MKNRRLMEMAGIIHRSTSEVQNRLSESSRERNKLARRHMKYGQDSFELEQLRQRYSKQEVIDQWDLFWNEETGTWFHSYYDRNGKGDAYDTGVADKLDPHRAALAADGVSAEADFLRASGQMGAMMESRLLLEEEEEGDDEAADDLFGDDEGDGDEEDDAGDDEGDEDDGGEEEEEEVEPPDKLTSKEIAELGPGEVDLELNTIMDDIFDKSQKAFQAGLQAESIHRKSMTSLLFENSDYDQFDMDRFARETARYINNYQNLIDVEGMLFNKAKETLLNQFGDMGQTAVDDFEEHMSRVHGIDLTGKFKEDIIQPTAVGSGGEGGAA